MTGRAGGASAPGKLMIAGEYAVLEGAPALVAAVGARARAFWSAPAQDRSPPDSAHSQESSPLPPEAMLARGLAEEEVGALVPCGLRIDVNSLRRSGVKLGLGSSAASAAAAAGAVFAYEGHNIGDLAVRRRVLGAAMEGHRAVAPEGSGADVAASVLGGVVRFVRRGEQFEAEPLGWPAELHARVVWTGSAARTSDLVRQVRALAERDPGAYRGRMDALAGCAAEFVAAFEAGDARAVVRAAGAYGEAMADLGKAAGAPIVEARLTRVAELARAAGGAAKPSGAGGGDVAVAFFADREAAGTFERACREAAMTLLDLQLGADGVLPLPA